VRLQSNRPPAPPDRENERSTLTLDELRTALDRLARAGWTVQLRSSPGTLPSHIKARYPWVPSDIVDFIQEIEIIASPDDKAWLLAVSDFQGGSSSAFTWDEFERLSTEAAKDNPNWRAAIRQCWDSHFPIGMSVKDGYAYLAIRGTDLNIVCGEEPEFEQTAVVASSLVELLSLLSIRDARLAGWL
jgi:hypothetical protein